MSDRLRLHDQIISPRGELLHLLFEAGWVPASQEHLPDGTVRIRFRDAPYTSDWGGMKSRFASGRSGLDAYRNLLIEIENERRLDKSAPYEPDPKRVALFDFYTHPIFWPEGTSGNRRAEDIKAFTNELARRHEELGYDNLIFRMHPETGATAIERWVEAGLRDHMPSDAVERIAIVCHPNHKHESVSLSVVPLVGDVSCH